MKSYIDDLTYSKLIYFLIYIPVSHLGSNKFKANRFRSHKNLFFSSKRSPYSNKSKHLFEMTDMNRADV